MVPILNHSLFIKINNNITNVIVEIVKAIGLPNVTTGLLPTKTSLSFLPSLFLMNPITSWAVPKALV